jgi:hypothetical protein
MTQPSSSPAPAPAQVGALAAVGPRSRASELILQLVIVTVGVLIALLLEGLVQWSRHRTLASEARANIREEIRENVRRLDKFFAGSQRFSEQRKQLRAVIDDLIAKKPDKGQEVAINFKLTQLVSAAWQTAGATGALGHMPYREVQSYAQAYDVQHRFESLQGDFLREFGRATMHGLDADRMTPAELQAWKDSLTAVESSIRMQEGLARVLKDHVYPGVLKEVAAGPGAPPP